MEEIVINIFRALKVIYLHNQVTDNLDNTRRCVRDIQPINWLFDNLERLLRDIPVTKQLQLSQARDDAIQAVRVHFRQEDVDLYDPNLSLQL